MYVDGKGPVEKVKAGFRRKRERLLESVLKKTRIRPSAQVALSKIKSLPGEKIKHVNIAIGRWKGGK